jgi:hypothetical protein
MRSRMLRTNPSLCRRLFGDRFVTLSLLLIALAVLLALPFGALPVSRLAGSARAVNAESSPVSTSRVAPVGTITVTDLTQKISSSGGCSLPEAIYSSEYANNIAPDPANPGTYIDTPCAKGTGDDTIVLPAGAVFLMSSIMPDLQNATGPTATPVINSRIIIEANGSRLEHVPNGVNFRAFAINPGESLTIRNAYIKGFMAKGGNGGGGGGGGLGAGGAIYINEGNLTVESCTFEGNGAVGGNGSEGKWSASAVVAHVTNPGGGGGGLGGNGGEIIVPDLGGGGGGGGSRGNGGRGSGGTGSGSGGGGTLEDGVIGGVTDDGGAGGLNCGGKGGDYSIDLGGRPGDDGACAGGGGGGGAMLTANGGKGNYGGGGGGGGSGHFGGIIFPEEGDGGDGGFGGGGGSGSLDSSSDIAGAGGKGGFGGGGGSGDSPGNGGSFGGNAGGSDSIPSDHWLFRGGGGAGLGGAIFNDGGTVRIINNTFTQNFVVRGVAGGAGAQNGRDAGGAIFSRNGSLTVLNSTISGNQSTGTDAGIFVQEDGAETHFILRNTIIANNGTDECHFEGDVTHDGSGNFIVNNLGCPGNVNPTMADPQLGPLQLNSPGNTPTMALLPTSPAIDKGVDLSGEGITTDQRGVTRPQGAAFDIGAYEFAACSTITCPTNVTQSNDPNQCGAVVNYPAPTVDGDCAVACSPASGTVFPVGTTTVTCTSGTLTCSFNVTVNDTENPIINCPGNISVGNDPGQCYAMVNPGTATATDNCSGVNVLGTRSDGQALSAPYPTGVTTITWKATDASNNMATCQQTITVNDMEPPVITASLVTSCLWPADHELQDVGLSLAVSDNCTPAALIAVDVKITSDEKPEADDGDGRFSPDATVTGTGVNRIIRLRRERLGSGDGRVYLIRITATDQHNNTSLKVLQVGVPLSQPPYLPCGIDSRPVHGGDAPDGGFYATSPPARIIGTKQ